MPKTRPYDKSKLKFAVRDVQNGVESYRSAEKKYGIPKSTIQFKIKHPERKDTFGPSPILSIAEEEAIATWIKDTARRGFPKTANDLKSTVQKYLTTNPRKHPFKNNRPGDGWLKAFRRRHPDISDITSKRVSSSRACDSEQDIRHWFLQIEEYIKEKGLEDVINDPSRVFNGEELGFNICPSTGKVFVRESSKNVCTVDHSSSEENITVMFTFSVDGSIYCPMVIYPYKHILEEVSQQWNIGRSDNGLMTTETFYEYIVNVFHPHLIQKDVKFPIILFLDGHKSHLNYSLSLFCNELQIELIALCPNATRILQPVDVAVFRPIKEAWRKTLKEWQDEHPEEIINTVNFAPLLEKSIKLGVNPTILINGFRAYGLCPFNPVSISFFKVLERIDDLVETSIKPDVTMTYSVFVDLVGKDKIELFKNFNEHLPDGVNDNFLDLFKVWRYFNDKIEEEKVKNIKRPLDEDHHNSWWMQS